MALAVVLWFISVSVCVFVWGRAFLCFYTYEDFLWSINCFFFPVRASQLLIRSAVLMLRQQFGRWILVGQPTFVDLDLTFRRVSKGCWMFIASDNSHSFREQANIKPSVWDKPVRVFSGTLCFIAYWSVWYLQLIQVWLQGGSEKPLWYKPSESNCLSLWLMKIMVMNVFGALWLSHQLFLWLSLWFNIALLILLIKKLIAFASLWSPFGETIW